MSDEKGNGLKQAGRPWYLKLDRELRILGLGPLNADACICMRRSGTEVLIVAIYVDDMLLFSNSPNWPPDLKQKFGERFQIKDLGKVNPAQKWNSDKERISWRYRRLNTLKKF